MINVQNNTKKVLQWSAVFAILGITLYPIVIHPMLYPENYRKINEENRKEMDKEKIQPGNMKIWSDPFNRK